jgi:UDP-glucose 4-epimerase
MKILITGANGFIGTHVAELLERESTVIRLTRKGIPGPNEIALNLTDEKAVSNALDADLIPVCDTIIHLAAGTASPDKIHDLDILIRNSVMAKSVALIAQKTRAAKLIHISSMAVYPNIDGTFSEDRLIDPSRNNDCIYGLSKFNEEVILRFFLNNTDTLISHLRLAMVYGKGMNESRIIPVMQKELRESNRITVFGNGERLLNLVEVTQAARIIQKFVKEDHPGVFNVGDECITMEQLAMSINSDNKGEIRKVEKGSRVKFVLDLTKMKSVTGNA